MKKALKILGIILLVVIVIVGIKFAFSKKTVDFSGFVTDIKEDGDTIVFTVELSEISKYTVKADKKTKVSYHKSKYNITLDEITIGDNIQGDFRNFTKKEIAHNIIVSYGVKTGYSYDPTKSYPADTKFENKGIKVEIKSVEVKPDKTEIRCIIETKNNQIPLIHLTTELTGKNQIYKYIEGSADSTMDKSEYLLSFESVGNDKDLLLFIELKTKEKISIPIKLDASDEKTK